MHGKPRSAVAMLALCSSAVIAAACGSSGGTQGDGGNGAADAIAGSTCVQYGNEAYLQMAIAGAHDGYFNWESESVECAGSFDDHRLSWEIPGLHAVTLEVPNMVPLYMADDNPAQMRLVLSGNSYDTGPDACVVNLIQNFEHDPEGYPGIYRVRGSGECAEPAQPVPPAEQVVNIVGSFVFAGYVLVSE